MFPVAPSLTQGATPARIPTDAARVDPAAYATFVRSRQTDRDLARYSRAILGVDPENLWAMLTLADLADTDFERTVILREAVRVGCRFWKETCAGGRDAEWHRGEAAGDFLRAVARYGLEMRRMGLAGLAEDYLCGLLEIDPEDRRGLAESLRRAGVGDGDRMAAGAGATSAVTR